MTYVKCPHCGDVIEVGGELMSEFTCLECHRTYKITARNSLKAPAYDAFNIAALLICGAGMIFTNALGSAPKLGDYIAIGIYMAVAFAVSAYGTILRKKTEEAFKKRKS